MAQAVRALDCPWSDSARAGGGALPVIMTLIQSSRNPRLPQLQPRIQKKPPQKSKYYYSTFAAGPSKASAAAPRPRWMRVGIYGCSMYVSWSLSSRDVVFSRHPSLVGVLVFGPVIASKKVLKKPSKLCVAHVRMCGLAFQRPPT